MLLRRLVVEREGWMDAREFEDANAACSLLPGPASTQLAILCAYRVRGALGALVGGVGFVAPAVASVLALSVLFLASSPPLWVRGAGAGAGAALAAVALRAGIDLLGPSYGRRRERRRQRARWLAYLVLGALAAGLLGSYLVAVLVACGLLELVAHRRRHVSSRERGPRSAGLLAPLAAAKGGIGALAWTALKVGALSFGGGFVIVPLMQGDAVHTYHWMSNQEFLNAVALGQITPGPLVATVAAVGYGAGGLGWGAIAAAVAFLPSFAFVLLGGRRFATLRRSASAQAFLDGAGPAAIGAILGAAIPLAGALGEPWQAAVLAAAALALLILDLSVVWTLLAAGAIGILAGLAGAPLP